MLRIASQRASSNIRFAIAHLEFIENCFPNVPDRSSSLWRLVDEFGATPLANTRSAVGRTHQRHKSSLSSPSSSSSSSTNVNQINGSSAVTAPLSNERLISFLIQKHRVSNADAVEVRLVLPQDGKSKSSIVSLTDAVQITSQLGLDLVGVNVEESPPVIKAFSLEKMLYQAMKRSNSSGGGKSKASKPAKEFSFKVGIHENDFVRKVDSIIKYLQKGHDCLISIRCSPTVHRNDPQSLHVFLDRLKALVDDFASYGKLKLDEEQTHGNIRLSPK